MTRIDKRDDNLEARISKSTSGTEIVLNEWGIPNWEDIKSYGDVAKWSDERWCWEFFRRRNDLRKFFDRWAGVTHQHGNVKVNEGLNPDMPGFLAFKGESAEKNGLDLFGYIGVPNPRIGDQPSWAIIRGERVLKRGNYYDPIKLRTRNKMTRSILRQVGRNEYHIHLHDNEYAIRFDLDKPLPPQMKNATAALKRAQAMRGKKPKQKRQQRAKYMEYLRTLDARATMPKASWRVFTEALFDAALLDRHTDPAGKYRAPLPTAGRDKWEAADALRFNF